MNKTDPIIHTKLRPPFTRREFVSRPRLQEEIAQGLCGPLTLVTAPAGFGKTLLVSSYITGCGMAVAWLSLDKNDNQTGCFLRYLIAALHEADHTIGSEALQLMATPQQMPPEAVLTSLVNDLDTATGEIVLVLDDYHVISDQAVHEEVAFLLEHCPNTFHLLIATRSDPPLPLARLRARGQAVELRAADLRFTEPEAAQFLNEVMGLHLDAGSVAALEGRTEGWIAGLQMAALSMRDCKDVLGFIEGFSGTNRYILDYLLEEVLASQPPEIQRFLLQTSILERLSAPLCDALIGKESTQIRESRVESRGSLRLSTLDSQSMLEYMERANLFLVPLDDERIWYRYHHLFADLLTTRLNQFYPGLASQLHAYAAAWLEREGMMVEAVNHYLAAGEYHHAAQLVEENTTRLLAQGELNSVMGWIEALPVEFRQTRPWLCIHQAYALAFAGRMGDVSPLLDQAEAILRAAVARDAANESGEADGKYIPSAGETESLSSDGGRSLAGSIAALRAMAAVMTGKDAEAIPQARQAKEQLPANSLNDRITAAWALGYAMHSQGCLPEARAAFEEQIEIGRAMDNSWALLAGQTYLAQVLQAQGQLHQARNLLQNALAEASLRGVRRQGYIAFVAANLARVLYEQNELESANRLLTEATLLNRQWPNPNFLVFTQALLARVLLASGDFQGARMSINEAGRVMRSAALTRLDQRWVEADFVRVWLAYQASGIRLISGDLLAEQSSALVAAWRSELASLAVNPAESGGDNTPMDECAEIAALILARVALAAGRAEEALTWLEPVTQRARAAGHIGAAIGSLALSAIARQAGSAPQSKPGERARGGDQAVAALADLEEALGLAEVGSYVRIFLDEGQSMQLLLAQWLGHAGSNPLRDYAIQLLSQFEAEPHVVTAAQAKISPAGDLVEPLSQRELEVLHLIALGRTNPEIAQQLIVAPGTIKAHAASIYRKLDVANRTEAVARAKQLGILP